METTQQKDHIGDTNKMVETPRTDEQMRKYVSDAPWTIESFDFARQLERELNAANAQVDRLTAKVAQLYEGAEEQKQRIVRRTPLGRLTSAEDVANAVYFLVSEQAAFITGQILVVDGGITC